MHNPFQPGFGVHPPLLAGRGEVLAFAKEAVETISVDHRMPAPLFLVGPRGVGKTVLLDKIATSVETEEGWPYLEIELTSPRLLTRILSAKISNLYEQLALAKSRKKFERTNTIVRAQLAGIGTEIHLARSNNAPVVESLE